MSYGKKVINFVKEVLREYGSGSETELKLASIYTN
jgi:hypothetical protein